MSAKLAALWGRTPEPTVRIQLPIGAGSSISVGGIAYEADADRYIDLPPDAAAELRAHFPRAADPVGGSGAALREEIRLIDAQLADLNAEIAKLGTATQRASELGATSASSAAAVEELSSLDAKRRSAIKDWVFGSAKRAAVDEDEAQHKAAAAKAAAKLAQDQKADELVALGVAEIRTRSESVDRDMAELRSRRDVALRRAIRSAADSAAGAYWAAAGELGRRLAYLHAHALLLAEMERGYARENIPGGAQSFGVPQGPASINVLPVYPDLALFKGMGCRSDQASCPFDLAAARERLRQDLVEQGLT